MYTNLSFSLFYSLLKAAEIIVLLSYSLTFVSELEMSQHAVELKRGHRSDTIVPDQRVKELAEVYSPSMLDGKSPMIVLKIQCQRLQMSQWALTH